VEDQRTEAGEGWREEGVGQEDVEEEEEKKKWKHPVEESTFQREEIQEKHKVSQDQN